MPELLNVFSEFVEVVAKLRSEEGCPWDREQTLETIKPYTLEETHELLEAIDSGDDAAIVEELGDVLLQVVLDAQIGRDENRFDLVDVVRSITAKMIRRHPHVFGDETATTAEDVKRHWNRVKQGEAGKESRQSVLDGIPITLPSLVKAVQLTKKAAKVGYDFPDRVMLFDKLREELEELTEELSPDGPLHAIAAGVDSPIVADEPIEDAARRQRAEDELGDVLFVIANIARRWGLDPEEALRRSNAKFSRRFQGIEAGVAAAGRTMDEASLVEMEEFYQASKRRESSVNTERRESSANTKRRESTTKTELRENTLHAERRENTVQSGSDE